jgi:putative transposase
VADGARQRKACAELDLSGRTYRRWSAGQEVKTDGRKEADRQPPRNKLSPEERAAILAVCHEPPFASLPPGQIVPRLADQGEYLASESSFYRILREAAEQHHRGRSQPPSRPARPTSYAAEGPCEVWSWDVTWLAGPARGLFFYLYIILDLFSRKIVAWEVYEQESAVHSAQVIRRAVLAEQCIDRPLVLHADNGSPMKGATLRATLQDLGIEPSYSRPRVSNDNPFSESLFRTCKYLPDFPANGFETLEAARRWVAAFVQWYNTVHCHSGIQFVTPEQRHTGQDKAILDARKAVYEQARAKHPERWSGGIRDWSQTGTVWLNPERPQEIENAA